MSFWQTVVEQTKNKYLRIGISVAVGSTFAIYLVSQVVVYRSKHTVPIRKENEKSQQLTIKQEQTDKNIKIGYSEYGNIKSKNVVFYLHGYPGSCLDLDAFYQFLFKSVTTDTRVIGIDRPGHGLSTYYDYTPKTFAYDLLKVADKLNIDSFIVMGVSGGAPFVLGCAVFLPSNRLKCVIPMIGIMPFDMVSNPYDGVVAANRMIFGLPYTMGAWIMYLGISSLNMNQDIDKVLDTMPLQYDKDVMTKYPFLHKTTTIAFQNGIRSGIAGILRMHLIAKYYKFWDFKIEDVCNNTSNKVYALYAIQDVNVSLSHGKWLKQQTKGYHHISVEFCDGFGHCSFLVNGSKYIAKIIDQTFDDD